MLRAKPRHKKLSSNINIAMNVRVHITLSLNKLPCACKVAHGHCLERDTGLVHPCALYGGTNIDIETLQLQG